jgi:Uncharacterized protein conserved in bacteria
MENKILHSGIKRFTANTVGRDFAVGDIHGSFTELEKALTRINFNAQTDRLFSVGDLVDRGPESDLALEWLAKPWFHSIQGNHESICMWTIEGDTRYAMYTDLWLDDIPIDKQLHFLYTFMELPLVIEIETPSGLVGIVHADFPFDDWHHLSHEHIDIPQTYMCQWSRERIDHNDKRPIKNIRAVIHGHTPLQKMAVLGNCYFIDTAGWMPEEGGFFTLLDLQTLEPATTS